MYLHAQITASLLLYLYSIVLQFLINYISLTNKNSRYNKLGMIG